MNLSVNGERLQWLRMGVGIISTIISRLALLEVAGNFAMSAFT